MSYDLFIKLLIVASSLGIGLATTMYFKMQPDNSIEEVSEYVIEQQTGIKIDLTPDKK